MKSFPDILYPSRRHPRADRQTAASMPELEYPAVLPRNATAWTCRHAALLVVTSSAGLVVFVVTHTQGHFELLSLAAGVCFAYGLGWSEALLLFLIPVVPVWVTGDPSVGTAFLLPAVCQLAFTHSFALHYVHLKTAHPVSPKIARETRERVCLLRFCVAVLFLILAAVALSQLPREERSDVHHGLSMLWHSFVPKAALIYLIFPPYDKLGAFLRAVREWVAYPDLNEPGVFQSPAGPLARRLMVVYLLAFLLAGPFALAFSDSVPDTMGELGPGDQTLVFMLLFLGHWWQWCRPVLTLFCTTFLLTAPVLCQARRVAEAARGSDLESFYERTDLSEAEAR